jgi:hypothetical protein
MKLRNSLLDYLLELVCCYLDCFFHNKCLSYKYKKKPETFAPGSLLI